MTNASNIRMDGNALIFISSGLRVEFPWPVTKVVEFENAYVAMIEPDTSSCFVTAKRTTWSINQS